MTTASDIALRRPDSAWQMFRVFTLLALQGFGGVLAVSQRELVERQRWLSRDDFLNILSLGQILPGPNIVNMGLVIGQRFFGWRGALASVGGLLALPLCIVMALAIGYTQISHMPAMAGALRGMGVVAAGLVAATAFKLVGALRGNAMGFALCLLFAVLAFVMVGWLRWPLVWVVLGLGGTAIAAARWRLRE